MFTEPALIDTFGRTNEIPLGNATWDGPTWEGDAEGRTNASGGALSNDASWGGSFVDTSYARDQKCSVEVVDVSPATSRVLLYARLTDPGLSTMNGYYLDFRKADGEVQLNKVTNKVGSVIATFSGYTIADGDLIGFELNGDTLSAHANTGGGWTELGNFLDTNPPVHSQAGRMGFELSESAIIIGDFHAGAITVDSGQDKSRMLITGTLANINVALGTLVFSPRTDFVGTGQLAMTSTTTTPLSDTDTISISVTLKSRKLFLLGVN